MKIILSPVIFCLLMATLLFVSCSKDEPERLPVTVTAVTPADQAKDVAVTQEVSITFSRAISKNAANFVGIQLLNLASTEIASAKTINDAGTVVTVKPTTALATATTFKVLVKNVATDDGVVVQTFNSSFATVIPPLTLASSVPANNAADVENLKQVVITFGKKIAKTQANLDAVTMGELINGTLYGFTASHITKAISEDGLSMTITMAANIASAGSSYIVNLVNVTAEDGGVLTAASIKFSTKNAPLGFASITPANGATNVATDAKIVIVFNKLMKNVLPGIATYGMPGETWTVEFDGVKILTLTCTTPLKNATKYELLKVGDIVSFAGEKMETLPPYSFTTAK